MHLERLRWKNMKIIDANIILRYLLNDVEDLAEEAEQIIENNDVFVPNEVIAEVVYVLEKVYKVERIEIDNYLTEFFEKQNISVPDKDVLFAALKLFSSKKLDFIDTILYGYAKVKDYEIFTFDKKLKKTITED